MNKGKVSTAQRNKVNERANACCEYCQSQARFATQSFSVEHILPLSKSGKNTLDNLAFSCQGCNNHKYNKTEAVDPVSGNTVPLFNPRKQVWSEQFVWNDDFSLVIGITATGRATVETLKLNRKNLINLRRVLYEVGEHPPHT